LLENGIHSGRGIDINEECHMILGLVQIIVNDDADQMLRYCHQSCPLWRKHM